MTSLKRPIIIAFGVLIAISGCAKTEPETTLDISIVQEPSGGFNVSSVSAQFQGRLNFVEATGLFNPPGSPDKINATVAWWWEDGLGGNDQIVKSENVTFSSESYTSKSTNHNAGAGFVLLNYYWVVITWTDEDGTHTVQSSKAFCF